MSESEVDSLRRQIKSLAFSQQQMHKDNRDERRSDRDTFSKAIAATQAAFTKAMDDQRDQFQISINKTFEQYESLRASTSSSEFMLKTIVGDGEQGSGRLGVVEGTVKKLEEFKWQALAVALVGAWLADKFLGKGH